MRPGFTLTLRAILASLGAIGAGLYLLQYGWGDSGDGTGGTSWFAIIGHGMGIYFIAKGLYLGPSLWHQAQQTRYLEELAWRSREERSS